MKMYQVKQSGNKFSVVEAKTNLEIQQVESRRQAKKLAKDLSNGKGFHGFTPSFFVANTAPESIWLVID